MTIQVEAGIHTISDSLEYRNYEAKGERRGYLRYVTRRKRKEVFYKRGQVMDEMNHPGGISSPQMEEIEQKFRTKRARRSSNRKAKNQRLAPSEVEQRKAWAIHVKPFHLTYEAWCSWKKDLPRGRSPEGRWPWLRYSWMKWQELLVGPANRRMERWGRRGPGKPGRRCNSMKRVLDVRCGQRSTVYCGSQR